MKSTIISLMLFMFLSSICVFSVQAQIPDSYQGKWRWNAPTVDAQFTNGTILIKKDSVITIYDGMAGKFASNNVIFRNDSV